MYILIYIYILCIYILCIYLIIWIHMYMYTYVYIYIGRERESIPLYVCDLALGVRVPSLRLPPISEPTTFALCKAS